jgi:hypothetical protein
MRGRGRKEGASGPGRRWASRAEVRKGGEKKNSFFPNNFPNSFFKRFF